MSPWTVKDRRRRNYARLVVMLAMGIAIVGVMGAAQATPDSEDIEAVGNAIESFSDRLASASDALGEYQDLANNLPLTDLAPGDPEGLDLSNLLDDAFGPLGSHANMAALATAIEARDGTYGGVTVQFGTGAFSQPAVTAVDEDTISIPIHATRIVNEPLEFAFGPVSMDGGSLAVDFVLDTTLVFNVDSDAITTAATAPATALSLVPPTIALCAHATGSVGVFTARFGFTDVKVSTDDPDTPATETAQLHACANVAFQDPDSTGGITLDEWSSHALTELATASIVDGAADPANDVDVKLFADASLIDGDAFTTGDPADASVRFTDQNLAAAAGGFNPTTDLDLGALDDWDNINAGDIANGLAQFVSSLAGAQGEGQGPLPFLKERLSQESEALEPLFDVVAPLTEYTSLLTNAEVGCGSEPGDTDSFPEGNIDSLAPGAFVYCRARTQQQKQGGTVLWTPGTDVTTCSATPADCTNLSGGGADATLGAGGALPSADAVFKMGPAGGTFTVELSWDSDPGAGTVTRKAIPLPSTAQELFARLADAAGLADGAANLGYSSATKSLSLRLQKDNFDPDPIDMNASFGDLLRSETNLAGLQDVLEGSGGASFEADVSNLDFDVTFGVILVPQTTDITPLRGTATAGSSGTTLADTGANFTDGANDPRLGQVVKKTSAPLGQCTIASITATTLTCATPTSVSWASGDSYDVDGGLADRFFLKFNPAAAEFSVEDISVTGSLSLTGKVGFLEIEAGGDGGVNTLDASNGFADGTAFGIARANASVPFVRVDIKKPAGDSFVVDTNGSTTGGEQTLADTIGVSELLFHLDDAHLDAVCNLKATAGLGISASVDGTELASGGVSAGWAKVFKDDSCDLNIDGPQGLQVDADTDFNTSLKDFDPYPSVSGVHDGGDDEENLEDTTKDFDANALSGGNLVNLTLRNKTTGASCTIITVDSTHLNCELSGGNRPGNPSKANRWMNGDEYETEGNVLALLGIILDHLDELVEKVDQIDPSLTEKEIPLVGISTKELVGKIQSVKQTIDELRGSPLAEIDCSKNPDGTNPSGFNVEVFPDNTALYCRAISTVEPDSVVWTAKELVGGESALTVTPGAFLPGPGLGGTPPIGGNLLETVGPDAAGTNQDDRVEVFVTDHDASDPTTSIDEWQVKAEFTDAAGNHTVEFPSTTPPQTLQELEKTIGEKLGIPNVLHLDLLDLPPAGAGPITTGTALGTSDANTLQSSENFTNGTADPVVGNTLINKDADGGPRHCTITAVATNSLECGAAGLDMDWGAGDDYEIVGDSDATKDLVVSLAVGFCSGGGLCETSDRTVDPLSAPLNIADDFADIIAVETEGDVTLHFDASANLDIGIPIKLDLTPDVVVLDTTGADIEAKLDANDIGLNAATGPISVKLGTTIVDTDPVTDGDQPGVGVGKIGAKLSVGETVDDEVPFNNTFTFGVSDPEDYFNPSNLDVEFAGESQDCDAPSGGSVEASGHACAVINVEAVGQNFADPITIECNLGTDPICDADLPPLLEGLISGEPLDWALLIQALPEILANLEDTLDGAAQDVHIPLVGDTLDAGAEVVGTFNENVVVPFADLAAQLTAAGDQDGDSDVDAWDLAKLTRQFVHEQLGAAGGVDLLRNTNGIPADPNADGDLDDIVVTPLCGAGPSVCADGDGVTGSNLIKDFRVTFKLGQAIDADVPFDIGLRGLPVRLQGGVHGSGSWSLLVDFGLSFEDGAYIVANGKAGATGSEDRPFDLDLEPEGAPDGTPDAHSVQKYLQDDGTNFNNVAEYGMWLHNTTTDEGCRVTNIELHKLHCDDLGTAATVEGVDWNGTDDWELRPRHAPDTPATGGEPELNLTASVGMADLPGGNLPGGGTCTDDQHDYTSGDGDPAYLQGFSATKCLAGELAFLAVTIRDTESGDPCGSPGLATGEDPTTLCLAASLDFKKTGGDRVTLSDLISGQFGLFPSISGTANVDVRFRTGLNVNQSAGFPSVLGKFHLFWGFSANPDDGIDFASLAVSFDGLNLDAGKFITQFLSPIVKQVKKITGPLMPVVELLQGEIPIISDLSKLIGEGPVTVLDVLEEVSGNDLSLLRSILQFIQFVNNIPDDGNLLISLGGANGGSFTVTSDRAGNDQPIPEEAGAGLTKAGDTQANLVDDFAGDSDYEDIDKTPDECDPDRGSTFGVCGLTFPFLGDAGQIFGTLMGKDATLVRYDAGTFGAGAGFGFCFPPILIGPVPVQICIGGSFRVEGRFAMGYDTSGLRKVLEGGSGTHLLDGIFLDDYNAQGQEVPEVKFIGTVYAEGAVSVYIFKVGIRGEIIFTTALDLHEDDPQDGKLRIEEIISRLANPLCLFDVTGKIEAALSAFVEIDLFITSVEFSIEIVRITLLEFDLDVCSPEPPNLADVVDGPGPGDKDELVLNVGPRAHLRNVAEGEPAELYTVRQMESFTEGPNEGLTRFSITAYGIQEDEFLSTAQVNNGEARLFADSAAGDDTISLLPGAVGGTQSAPNQQNPPVPFRLNAVIRAGADLDEITTGDGNDDVEGGSGDDRLITGIRADRIRGDEGNDNIDAGDDNDTDVEGGADNDTINGGKGGDTLKGNGGNDVVSAGPDNGIHVDVLHGNDGSDTLTGDLGDDDLYGDEVLSFDCSSDGVDSGSLDSGPGGDNSDTLIGGDGDDEMHGGAEEDSLDGGNGNDTMCGGGDDDEMAGGAQKDTMEGGGGDDNMVGGTDNSPAASGGDSMNGDAGRDYMLGDEGTLTRDGSSVAVSPTGSFAGNDTMNGGDGDDFMWGQGGLDAMNGDANDDEMRGGAEVDTMNGNGGDDEMYGELGADLMHGNADNDLMRGGPQNDTMDGDEDTDEMYGDGEPDIMRGGAADDLMRGGGGDDEMEGNANSAGSSALPLDNADPYNAANFDLHLVPSGTNGWAPSGGTDGDLMYGDADQDDIVGGSQGGSPPADGGDTILGNHAQDVIVGDNGDVSRSGGSDPDGTTTRSVMLDDPGAGGGGDWIQGNDENDDVYAGGGGDLVHGDAGDDYVEGNGGSDGEGDTDDVTPLAGIGLYGDSGQDDLIGGTSQGDGGVGDGADDLWGGQGHDVATGDNAEVTRTGGGTCDGYVCNTFRAGDVENVVIRVVKIWDVDTTTFDPVAGTSGGDTIGGQDAHDRLYGQGGGDRIEGGLNDDFAFGNAGADTINGNDGQDDLVGGTGRTDSSSPSSAEDGRIDTGDVIQGQDDYDAISGDNARVVRQTDDADGNDNTGEWTANTFNDAVDRLIALMDIATTADDEALTNGTSGNDELLGGDEDDVVYGQGGNDGISGGLEQDLLEGNANGTGDAPDPAGTYGTDWPAFAGDVIHGDEGADDASGGTGRIYRMVLGDEVQDPASGVDGRKDGADTIFGDGGGDALAGDNTVIERALQAGEWILDDLHSPDAEGVVRRVMRERDVATTLDLAPLTNDTNGADTIYGNDGVDVAYGQGADDTIEGNAHDDHLEGNAGDDTITGNEGQDDVIGGTGRTFSNDEATAVGGRIDNPVGDDAPNDTLHGGDGLGGVAADDDDVVVGDNATVDRVLGTLGTAGAELNRLPFNGEWGEATWDEPNILRVVRLLDVSVTGAATPETNGTNGADTLNGEANEDVIFGQGGNDAITGDDADLVAASAADANPGDDYIEGNGGQDTIRGDLGQDDITGGGSAANGVLDANRDGRFDDTRSGETLRDAGDTIEGDSNDGAVGDGDVVAGDNARIQRKLETAVGPTLGDWRVDAARGIRLRDVVLFDIRIVGNAEPGNADPGESGVDAIDGNGGNDVLLGQDNGQADDVLANAYGTESGAPGTANCQDATGGPGSGTLAGTEEAPNGDNDDDDLPDLNDPECRVSAPGDTIHGEGGQDYIEGNAGSDTLEGNDGEDDVVGGSSANTGHLNVILPPSDRDAGFTPTALTPEATPANLNDGHDAIQGNAEDDTVLGDNGFVDRYLTPTTGAWIAIAGAGSLGVGEIAVPAPEPEKAAFEPSDLVRRDVTTRPTREDAGAFGNDYVRGGTGQDDVYGTLGNDWLEGNENEDAIVGDMGKIVDNVLGLDDPIDPPDPPEQFVRPQQPFLGATIDRMGVLKREVTLYAFDQSVAATAGIGHDVALGGDGNDWIHTGPGEDLANGNAGDDRLFLGDNATATTAPSSKNGEARLAHDKVDAGWGGTGYDHVWGGYGADYSDVRPRTVADVPGLFPASDPETWFQIAGAGPTAGFPPPAIQELSQNGVDYGHGDDNFGDKDYHYGGWDQDTLQANVSDNGPHVGDRLLDWGGSYNGYYLCASTYGDWVSTRALAPGVIAFLQAMSQGDGATTTATTGTSGFRETAIVFTNEQKDNTKPIHVDTPAHFTCGPGITDP